MKVRNTRRRRGERWLRRYRARFRQDPRRRESLPLAVTCWSHGKPRRGKDVVAILMMEMGNGD